MRLIQNESAKQHDESVDSPSADAAAEALQAPTGAQSIPFEILAESIVPGQTNVPAILQGTFFQVTCQAGDAQRGGTIAINYFPTVPFVPGPTKDKVVLAADYIDSSLNVKFFTDLVLKGQRLTLSIPVGKTIIVGLQYFIDPKAVPSADASLTEELGNRGSITVIAGVSSRFLITATVRQNFIRSLQNPMDIISSSAYSVALSDGPILG